MEKKKILVTAGSTVAPIDQVRVISNIFNGRTGTEIALHFAVLGHEVTLLTSNKLLLYSAGSVARKIKTVIPYKEYDHLYRLMQLALCASAPPYDVVIHSAAVSDYSVADVGVKNERGEIIPIDNSAKVSSDHAELFLRLVQTQKIIDLIRQPWEFAGYLVKFKLQVGITDEELLAIAEKSRVASQADMIVANCLEWSRQRAYVMIADKVVNVERKNLATVLAQEILK